MANAKKKCTLRAYGQQLSKHISCLLSTLRMLTELSLFHKFVVPASLRPESLPHLRAMKITANSLLPGIVGLGRSREELVNPKVAKQ